MHANTVFLLGLGLLLVVGRGYGYIVPEDGPEGRKSDIEEENIARSDDLNRLELREDEDEDNLRDEDSLDPTRPAARSWLKSAAGGAAASRPPASRPAAGGAAAAGAAAGGAAAAAAAAARMSDTKRTGSRDLPTSNVVLGLAPARYGMRNEETILENDEIARQATLKYMDNDTGMRSADYEDFMKNADDDDYIAVMRDEPNLDLYYRHISDPLRQYEEEMRSMDEAVAEEPDSFTKRVLESIRESTPQVYFRLLENAIRSDITRRSSAAAAAAAAGRKGAAAAAAAAARSAAAAAAARSAAAAAAASRWRSAVRSAAAAAAASRRSAISPIPTGYRSAAAAAAAAGRRLFAARSAAPAAASRKSAAAASAASWRNME